VLTAHAAAIAEWLKAGGNLLALGCGPEDANSFLPFKIATKKAEHISTFFEPFAMKSLLVGIGPGEVHNRDPRDFSLICGGARIVGDGVLAQAENANVIFCQLEPWQFDASGPSNLKRTRRRATVLLSRLLANMGVAGSTPLVERFHQPMKAAQPEKRWLTGVYVDQPEEWDDPYRFFRW
jgi:hypothetical protein